MIEGTDSHDFSEEIARHLSEVAERLRGAFPNSSFYWPASDDATEKVVIDWVAWPERVAACLGRAAALRVLDATDVRVGEGGRRLQEEYAEWRVMRSTRGVEKVDVTVETADYWRALAAHAPDATLDAIGSFAGETRAEVSGVYGKLDPFDPRTRPSQRGEAFADTMLSGGTSPYNNGARAITCMVHPDNSMTALLRLAFAATLAWHVIDSFGGHERCPSCSELADSLGNAAMLGRASDPLVVERLAWLAFEGRRVALDVPGPLAISGVESARLRTPSGQVVPPGWFTLSRPMREGERYQRVSLQVPPDQGYCVSDLMDVTTEEKVTSGAQVADLVQISLHLLVTEPRCARRGKIDVSEAPPPRRCDDITAIADELMQA